MRLYRKVIRPYFKDNEKTPEFMNIFHQKWFDESLVTKLYLYIAEKMNLDGNELEQIRQLKEHNLVFEKRYIEYEYTPKDSFYINKIYDNMDDFIENQYNNQTHIL